MDGSPGAGAASPAPPPPSPRRGEAGEKPPAGPKQPRFVSSPGRGAGSCGDPAGSGRDGARRWQRGRVLAPTEAGREKHRPAPCPKPSRLPSRCPEPGLLQAARQPCPPAAPGGWHVLRAIYSSRLAFGYAGSRRGGGMRSKKEVRSKGRKAPGLGWPSRCCVAPSASAAMKAEAPVKSQKRGGDAAFSTHFLRLGSKPWTVISKPWAGCR